MYTRWNVGLILAVLSLIITGCGKRIDRTLPHWKIPRPIISKPEFVEGAWMGRLFDVNGWDISLRFNIQQDDQYLFGTAGMQIFDAHELYYHEVDIVGNIRGDSIFFKLRDDRGNWLFRGMRAATWSPQQDAIYGDYEVSTDSLSMRAGVWMLRRTDKLPDRYRYQR